MRFVYDIETYINFFSATFRNYDNVEEKLVFEISSRKDDSESLKNFLSSSNLLLIGFNSIHYDNIVLNYFHKSRFNKDSINRELKNMSDSIIESETFFNTPYKYNQNWKSIDLFLYWSKMLRISKKLSLKSIAINMNWHKIQELPIEPNEIVKEEDMDKILEYNDNDVLITYELCKRMSKDINLRYAAKKRYGLQCENWDGVKLGLNILLKRYCSRKNLPLEAVKNLRSPRLEGVKLSDIILKEISFDETGTLKHDRKVVDKKILNIFYSPNGLLHYLKNLTVYNTDEINCRLYYKGTVYDVKSGGLHSVHNPEFVERLLGFIYKDIDVSSYYPTFGAMWKFVPEHLGEEMAEELDSVRLERIDLKARGLGKSDEAELLKLSMNGGFYGNTNNEHTPMYDPKAMLSITINGQLFLIMLAEKLVESGVKIDMANTDGLTLMYREELSERVKELCKEWEKISRTSLEEVDYIKVARKNINNYLAVYDNGKTKEKGQFLSDPPVDMSRDFLVITKAINEYILKGTPIEDFIRSHKNIYDFCASQKVDKKYSVYWNGEKQQRLNRYYVSKRGAYLYKSIDGKEMHNLLKGFAVQLFNNYEEKKDYNIQYEYYISKARQELNEIYSIQTSLFD